MPGTEPDKAGRSSSRAVEWYREYVYGTIATLVAIGALTFDRRPDQLTADAVIVVGAVAIWLAHTLSHLVADWALQEAPFSTGTVVARLRQSWPILAAALPAVAVLALSWSVDWTALSGLWIAEGVGVAALAVVGVLTAGDRRRSLTVRVAYVVALVTTGLVIVGLELLAHAI
jgi:hypothetical protein